MVQFLHTLFTGLNINYVEYFLHVEGFLCGEYFYFNMLTASFCFEFVLLWNVSILVE